DARGVAAGGLERAVCRAALAAGGLGGALGGGELLAQRLELGAPLLHDLLRLHARRLERDELALETGFVVGGQPIELRSEYTDALTSGCLERTVVGEPLVAGFEHRQLVLASPDT